jgi:hypothetical protein
MLGIRHLNGTAIDLWCGNASEFVADFFSSLNDVPEAESFSAEQIKSGKCNKQHICAIFVGSNWDHSELVKSVREIIDGVKTASIEQLPRRITMIFADIPTYKIAQQALFSEIPELDDI